MNSKCSRVLVKTTMLAVNAPRAIASEDSDANMAMRRGDVKARDAAARCPARIRPMAFQARGRHSRNMAQPHPHTGATYRVTRRPDNSYGAEVIIEGMNPTLITGFA